MCIGGFPQDATTLWTTFPFGVNMFSNYRTVSPSSTEVSTYIVNGIFLAQLLLQAQTVLIPFLSCFGPAIPIKACTNFSSVSSTWKHWLQGACLLAFFFSEGSRKIEYWSFILIYVSFFLTNPFASLAYYAFIDLNKFFIHKGSKMLLYWLHLVSSQFISYWFSYFLWVETISPIHLHSKICL